MTLKQKRLLQAIPTSKSLSEAAKKAGYSDNSSNSNIYTYAKNSKGLKGYFDENYIRKEIRIAVKKVKSKQDYTNLFRGLELMSKIEGLQIDKSESKVNLNTEEKVKSESLVNRILGTYS